MAEPISKRKVLQDLGYAPRLNAPEPVAQPQAFVQTSRPDAQAINQLVQSLGQFNSSLQRFGDVGLERQVDEAPAKALATLEEAKKQTEQTIGQYVSAKLISEGASPKVRQLTYQLIGERMAAEDYNKALFAKRNQVATEENPRNPEDIIAETRQEFLERLGDNMFIKAGADAVMLNADNQFRSHSRADQDRLFEEKVRSEVGIGIQQTIEGAFTSDADDATKAEGVNKMFDYLSRLRASGVQNPNQVFLTNVATAAASLAQKQKFAEARELLEAVDTRGIVGDKGENLGVYGQREDAKAVIARSLQTIDNMERQNEERNEVESNRARQRKIAIGGEAAANVISEAIKNGRLFDPNLETEVRTAVEQVLPSSLPGGNGVAILDAISTLAKYRNSPQASDPQALTNFQNALDRGDMEAAEAIMNGPTVSASHRVALTQEFNKAKSFSDILRSPTVGSALNQMQGLMRRASKAVTEQGEEVLDELSPERSALMVSALGAFRSAVFAEVKATRAKYPDMDNDTFAFTVLPEIVTKHQEKVLGKFQADWNLIEKRQGFGEAEVSGKPMSLSAAVKQPKEPFFRAMRMDEKVSALNGIADSVGRALEKSGAELSLFDQGSQQTLAMLAKKRREYWPAVVELGKTIAANPTASEGLKNTYFNIRNRFGYSADEVTSGVSKEGVILPIEEWQKRGLAFTTPMFSSHAEFLKLQESYRELAAQLADPELTPEDKRDLEADEALHPFTRMTQQLGLTNDKAVGAFVKAQDKVLRALGNVVPDMPAAPQPPVSQATPAATPPPEPDAAQRFMKEFDAPEGLDWFSNSNKILENRDNLRKALFSVIAEKFGVTDERLGASAFSTPAWKKVSDKAAEYSAKFDALPAEERNAAYAAALERVRVERFSAIKVGK